MAIGIDGLFLETHIDPDSSPSDGANMLPLDRLPRLLDRWLAIRETVESPL
jgi:2-dehydro-3-deoxyphosphooctonate aldolase (KDO 8-P synthase)